MNGVSIERIQLLTKSQTSELIAKRFRGFLPVVVDVETAGFNAETDALLEITAVLLCVDERGRWEIDDIIAKHVIPFPGANLDQASLDFTGIDPYHPLRIAASEEDVLSELFSRIRGAVKQQGCTRAVLVGHNPAFDLAFVNAAAKRADYKRNPFHPFTTFDTASLAGLAYGQTVLSRAVKAAGFEWDPDGAHSARYDAEMTARLFCSIVNNFSVITDDVS